jgi:hypothetical protein
MPEEFGRRDYDHPVTSDHDLLVRIDERLSTHLMAYLSFLQQYARDLAQTETRLASLEQFRAESDGAARANAKTIAAIVGASSGLTGLAIWALQHFVK